MELTNELKERFEMLYYGQMVSMLHKPEGRYSDEIFKAPQILTGPNQSEYLSLRPISSITQEEATEMAHVVFPEAFNAGLERLRLNDIITYLEGKQPIDSEEDTVNHMFHLGDWLRSKGFALPFMGIPVDQWVEWGVVKLKS